MHIFLKPYLLKPIYFTLILPYHKIRVLQGPVFVMTFSTVMTIQLFINNLGNSLIKLASETKLERRANINVLENIIQIQNYLEKLQ